MHAHLGMSLFADILLMHIYYMNKDMQNAMYVRIQQNIKRGKLLQPL